MSIGPKVRQSLCATAPANRESQIPPATGKVYLVQLKLPFIFPRPRPTEAHLLLVGAQRVPVSLVRNPRARRYILRLRPDGSVRVTIPRAGSITEAKRFAERNAAWLEKQLQRRVAQLAPNAPWLAGTKILFRGECVPLVVNPAGKVSHVRFGAETLSLADATGDLRPAVEHHLRRLAARELPARVLELAALHQFSVKRVTVRNQRSRWGSCSRRGTISLNWRLVQAPLFVCDYILLHELVHLRQMNHSHGFWREVVRLCPDFAHAERWLKQHAPLLR